MKIKYVLFGFIILVLVLSSCQKQPQIVCNKPYILVGNSCCLDKNSNSACDSDESKEEVVKETKPICNKPYIQVGATCCLDKNDNKVCDNDEKEEIITKETQNEVTYDISDVQANINKVTGEYFDEVFFKRSDKSKRDFDFYTDDKKTTIFLVKSGTGGKEFLSVLEKFSITLIDITDKEKYLEDKDKFFEFIKNQVPLLTNYLDIRKNSIIYEVKEGDIRDYFRTTGKDTSLNFVNYSLSKNMIYDNVTQFDTVSDKIIETVKLSFENYDVWYNNSNGKFKNFEPIGLEYLQAYSIYCTPNLIITIYANGYKEPRGYSGSFDEVSFKNLVGNERKKLLNEAQALINMCEERYDKQFSYLRWR